MFTQFLCFQNKLSNPTVVSNFSATSEKYLKKPGKICWSRRQNLRFVNQKSTLFFKKRTNAPGGFQQMRQKTSHSKAPKIAKSIYVDQGKTLIFENHLQYDGAKHFVALRFATEFNCGYGKGRKLSGKKKFV